MELTEGVCRIKNLMRMPAALVLFVGLCLGLITPPGRSLEHAQNQPETEH